MHTHALFLRLEKMGLVRCASTVWDAHIRVSIIPADDLTPKYFTKRLSRFDSGSRVLYIQSHYCYRGKWHYAADGVFDLDFPNEFIRKINHLETLAIYKVSYGQHAETLRTP